VKRALSLYVLLRTGIDRQSMLGAPDLAKIGSIHLIILRWSCKGLSQVDSSQTLSDPKLRLFLDMIQISDMYKHNRYTLMHTYWKMFHLWETLN
jgi:hypothetical protein